jgi:hypothetical protein
MNTTENKNTVPRRRKTAEEKNQIDARELRAKVDVYIDSFCFEDDSKNFSLYNFLKYENPSHPSANYLLNYVTALHQELLDKEGFEHLPSVKYKSWLKFHQKLVDDATRYFSSMKVPVKVRKKRAIKPKSPDKLIKNLKYKKEDTDQNLVSIDPVNIIKAQCLWVYNTKYRQLSVYHAIDDGGLSVKGTTITQFDKKTSMTKRLRKPHDVLPKLLSCGAVVLNSFMNDIKTNTTVPTGRINEETVLLRVVLPRISR